jgi:bacterioferritin
VVQNAKKTVPSTRDALIQSLNEDLAREYQAVIASVVYSQVLKGAEYMNIARELEKLAAQELQHALTIAKQVDHLGGTPIVQPKPVQVTDANKTMLRADLVPTVIDRH